MEFKVGDEVWWFKLRSNIDSMAYSFSSAIKPGDVELVHDQVKEIKDDLLQCWHCVKHKNEIWGKSRFEAWKNLKAELEKWGALDGTS